MKKLLTFRTELETENTTKNMKRRKQESQVKQHNIFFTENYCKTRTRAHGKCFTQNLRFTAGEQRPKLATEHPAEITDRRTEAKTGARSWAADRTKTPRFPRIKLKSLLLMIAFLRD
jgi:hypothetical protein